MSLHDNEAIQYAIFYRRDEWWDKGEGARSNSDVQYSKLARAATFVFSNHACSTPIFEPEKISAKVDLFLYGSEQQSH